MSDHSIPVIEVGEPEPHPNAERLEIMRVRGWTCCVGKGEFKRGDRAVYIPPDFTVPVARPEFAFLAKTPCGECGAAATRARIKVKRLRGIVSQGLLIKLPADVVASAGDDVAERLGVERYEPPAETRTSGVFVSGPKGVYAPKFDIECYQQWPDIIAYGEEVVVTEKIHGASARYACINGELYCGSRAHWMADDEKCVWWTAARHNPAITGFCADNPGVVLYGEVFGPVQKLRYGSERGRVFFAGFAMLRGDTWLDYPECIDLGRARALPWVPELYRGPMSEDALALAEGPSTWPGAKHIREGIVITPLRERTCPELGRVALKVVSSAYLEKD